MTITRSIETATPACLDHTALYQHPLLEDGTAGGTAAERRLQADLTRRAATVCASCPLAASCLYSAVVEHDVAGFVAGTTPRQRAEMRTQLRVKVVAEDLDSFAGVTAPNRQIDHDEVVRLRQANPYASLEQIAQRLGCSLSTVKRHLRKERRGETTPRLTSVKPSLEQVLHAYRVVVERGAHRTSRAA